MRVIKKGSLGLLDLVYQARLWRTEPRTELNLQSVLPVCKCSGLCLLVKIKQSMRAATVLPAPQPEPWMQTLLCLEAMEECSVATRGKCSIIPYVALINLNLNCLSSVVILLILKKKKKKANS